MRVELNPRQAELLLSAVLALEPPIYSVLKHDPEMQATQLGGCKKRLLLVTEDEMQTDVEPSVEAREAAIISDFMPPGWTGEGDGENETYDEEVAAVEELEADEAAAAEEEEELAELGQEDASEEGAAAPATPEPRTSPVTTSPKE